MPKSHAIARQEVKAQRKAERKQAWARRRVDGKEFFYHYLALAFAAVMTFIGLQSVLSGDRIVVGVISTVIVILMVDKLQH